MWKRVPQAAHYVPHDGEFFLRYSDNVLEDDLWTVGRLIMRNGVCVVQEIIQDGVYRMAMLGMTEKDIREEIETDPTGSFPEQYVEIVHKDFH